MSQDKDKIADALHALSSGAADHAAQPAHSAHPVPNPQPRVRNTGVIESPVLPNAPVPPRPTAPPAKPLAKASAMNSIGTRQMLIPCCLVSGVMLLGFCIVFYFSPENAAIKYVNPTWPIGFGIGGTILLALGITNMMIVKSQLAMQKPRS